MKPLVEDLICNSEYLMRPDGVHAGHRAADYKGILSLASRSPFTIILRGEEATIQSSDRSASTVCTVGL